MIQPRQTIASLPGSHTNQPSPPPHRLVNTCASIAIMLGSAGMLVSCSSRQTTEQRVRQVTAHIESPIRILEARAELESLSPMEPADQTVLRAITPDAITPMAVGSPAFTRALMSQEQIAASVEDTLGELPDELGDGTPRQVEPQMERRRVQAIKLYSDARSLRQTGQLQEAVELLQQAARLDPESGAIMRELGDVLIVSNDRVSAVRAFSRAFELGDRSARVLVHLASEASSREEWDRIIALTSLAMDDPAIVNFPLTESIAGVLLGTAQINSGYLKAGADTLDEALTGFDLGSRDLRWKRELIQILSQRTQLWILVGDAWSAMGASDRAQDAYTNAGRSVRSTEQVDSQAGQPAVPVALVARQIGSALRLGHPAKAALIFLDHLQDNASDLSFDERVWARTIASMGGVADRFGPAIGELSKRPGLTSSMKKALLGIEMIALTTESHDGSNKGSNKGSNMPLAVERLARAGSDAHDSMICFTLLDSIEDEADRYRAAVSVLDVNPGAAFSMASGLFRTLDHPVDFMTSHSRSGAGRSGAGLSRSQELLLSAMGISMERSDLIGHLDSIELSDELSEYSDEWVLIHAQASALRGQWDLCDQLLTMIDARMDSMDSTGTLSPEATRLLASTLVVVQQPDRAWALISSIADGSDASVEDLLVAAQIGQTLEAYEASAAYLERASQIDPYDEKVYEQLFLLRSSPGPTGDEQELQVVARQLATARPRSAMLALIRASDLSRNGLMSEAEAVLIGLNSRGSQSDIGLDLLLSIWKTQQVEGQETAMEDGVEFLESKIQDAPNSIELHRTLAQMLFDQGAHDESLALLNDAYARTGSQTLARVIEQLLSGTMDRADESRTHLLARLDGQRGVDPTLELIRDLSRREDNTYSERITQINGLLEKALPDGSELLPAQVNQLTDVVFTLANAMDEQQNQGQDEGSGSGSGILELIAQIDEHSDTLSFALSRVKIILMSQQTALDMDRLIETVHAAVDASSDEDERALLMALPMQSLIGADRTHEAIMLMVRFVTASGASLIEEGSVGTGTVDEDSVVQVFRLMGALGVNSDMIGVLEQLEEAGMLEQAIEITTVVLGTPERVIGGADGPTVDQLKADLAYTAAAMATAFERPAQAAEFYELSLSYDPTHGWANNDYGYMLAEEGVRIERAVRMLEAAAGSLPSEASVIDSLGWVRYKMGILEDTLITGAGGGPVEGAITLLMKAQALDIEQDNATISLHLGDALWRGGYRDRAIDAWLQGEDIARSQLRLVNAQEIPNQRAIEVLSAELREIRRRIQDAETSGKPSIAPLAIEEAIEEANETENEEADAEDAVAE